MLRPSPPNVERKLKRGLGAATQRLYSNVMTPTICFVASEVAPLSKTGGLGDVAGALPRRLRMLGCDVRVITPLYASIDRSRLILKTNMRLLDIPLRLGAQEFRYSLVTATSLHSDTPLILVDCPELYHRDSIYTADADEHVRFLVLQLAAIEYCLRTGFAPDIMHCNDWHAALLPLLLRARYSAEPTFARTRSLLSIHNIGYQGVFALGAAALLGLAPDAALLDSDDAAQGVVNWLKEGVRHAHRVATVSPTYAQEICAPLGGQGLDAALRARGDRIAGILNGVDYDEWDPAADAHLPHRYSIDDLSGKRLMKRALLDRMSLTVTLETPLIGMVSRLTQQKGVDLLFDVLPRMLRERPFAIAVLGSGERRYRDFFSSLARDFPGRATFFNGYSEELAHWIEAGSDIFLMPSMYEPCGLNQLYSLKYGAVPIVRRTGGLADSVQMWDAAAQSGTGIVFNDFDAFAAEWAIRTALDLYRDGATWRQLMRNGMAQDFSWEHQAREYLALYRDMTAR